MLDLISTEAAWKHNSKINGKELKPSNHLWPCRCIQIPTCKWLWCKRHL